MERNNTEESKIKAALIVSCFLRCGSRAPVKEKSEPENRKKSTTAEYLLPPSKPLIKDVKYTPNASATNRDFLCATRSEKALKYRKPPSPIHKPAVGRTPTYQWGEYR
jgi:hypothetical protein